MVIDYITVFEDVHELKYRSFSYCIDYRRSERVGPFTRITDQIEPKTRLDMVNFWSANSGKWPNPFRSP